MKYLLDVIAVASAGFSAWFAFKAFEQNKMSQIPILDPIIIDVTDPHLLQINIQNIGNGLAKNIRAKLSPLNEEITFESDLLPKKHQDYIVLTMRTPIKYEEGNNPLFNNGELLLNYEDVFGNKLSMKAKFKPDVLPERKTLGHIDKNFSGSFY